jgi:hypothetical protein
VSSGTILDAELLLSASSSTSAVGQSFSAAFHHAERAPRVTSSLTAESPTIRSLYTSLVSIQVLLATRALRARKTRKILGTHNRNNDTSTRVCNGCRQKGSPAIQMAWNIFCDKFSCNTQLVCNANHGSKISCRGPTRSATHIDPTQILGTRPPEGLNHMLGEDSTGYTQRVTQVAVFHFLGPGPLLIDWVIRCF